MLKKLSLNLNELAVSYAPIRHTSSEGYLNYN